MTETLYSEPAEQAVLSAILMDPAIMTDMLGTIEAADFYRPGHSRLFQAYDDLYSAGSVIDPLTLADRLDVLGHLDSVGGREYIAYLIDVVPTAANAEYHTKIVRELSERRQLITVAKQLIASAENRTLPVTEAAQRATEALLPAATDTAKGGYRSLHSLTYEVMDDIEQAHLGKALGLSFGYRDMDRLTGGILRGELLMLGSVPGAGKTAAAVNIGLNAAERGEGVAIVSAEMKDRGLAKRILANRAQVNSLNLRTGKIADAEFVRLGTAAGQWSKLPMWIDDTATPDIALIQARARALKAEHPTLAWLIVDFIQLVGSSRDSDEIRALALTNIAYALKGLAKQLDIAVIATFQVDASGIERRDDKRPQLSDQRWSQGMREAADLMALAYRPAMYKDDAPDVIELDFKKARDLPPFKVTLSWVGAFMRINDLPRPIIVAEQLALVR